MSESCFFGGDDATAVVQKRNRRQWRERLRSKEDQPKKRKFHKFMSSNMKVVMFINF